MSSLSGSLRAFLDIAVGSKTVRELRDAYLKRGNVLPSRGWGITLLNERFELVEHAASNVPDGFLARYERDGMSIDPILPLVLQRQAPVHNLEVASLEDWRRHPLFHEVMSPFGLQHVLFAPVVNDGRIVMTLHFGRGHSENPFGTEEAMAAAAMANHMSSILGRIARSGELPELAEREMEIARLASAGLNNAEIARCLSISPNTVKGALKRVFRKLGVDSRAEMASVLSSAGRL